MHNKITNLVFKMTGNSTSRVFHKILGSFIAEMIFSMPEMFQLNQLYCINVNIAFLLKLQATRLSTVCSVASVFVLFRLPGIK